MTSTEWVAVGFAAGAVVVVLLWFSSMFWA